MCQTTPNLSSNEISTFGNPIISFYVLPTATAKKIRVFLFDSRLLTNGASATDIPETKEG